MDKYRFHPQKALLHFIFLLSGIAAVIIGPLLPQLEKTFVLNDLQLGYFFPAQFAGSLIGTLMTNIFGRRGKFMAAVIIGAILMAGGVLLMNGGSFQLCLGGFFVNGLGIGLTLPSINMVILGLNPERSAAALTFLNFFWGVGAIFSKPFVDYFTADRNIFWMTFILALPLTVAAIILIFVSPEKPKPTLVSLPEELDEPPIWTTAMAWAIALFNFIHVGFESGMGGWLATYTERVETTTNVSLVTPTFLYFLCFVVGRGVAPSIFRYLNENQMLLASLLVTLGGMAITLLAQDLTMLSLGASISGFGTAAIFPTNLSRFSKMFGPTAVKRATPFFVCGTLGATATTWLIGLFSYNAGDLKAGMIVLAVSLVLLIILQLALQTRKFATSD